MFNVTNKEKFDQSEYGQQKVSRSSGISSYVSNFTKPVWTVLNIKRNVIEDETSLIINAGNAEETIVSEIV